MRITVKLIVVAWLIFLLNVPAMAAEPVKIGIVDIQEFQKKSKNFQNIRQDLKKKYDALQDKLEQERKALLVLEEDFKKQSMMLSLDAKEDKRRDMDKKRRYYQYLYEDLTQEMKNAEMEATKQVTKELEKVVEKIGKSEGYKLILERKAVGLIYFDDAIDMTNRVIDAYDRMK